MSNRNHPYIEVEDNFNGLVTYNNGGIMSFYAMNYNSYDAPIEIEVHYKGGIAYIRGNLLK